MKTFFKIMTILSALFIIIICMVRLYKGELSGVSDIELIILLIQVALSMYLFDFISRD